MAGKKRTEASRVVLVMSGETAWVEEQVAALQAEALGDAGSADLDAVSVHVGDRPLSDVLADARQVPFLSRCRFVVVRHLDRTAPHALGEVDLDAIEAYCESPAESSMVVFTAANLAKNRRPYTTLNAKAEVRARTLPEREDGWHAWIREELGARKIAASDEIVRRLYDRIGGDAPALANEIDKLRCYLGDRNDAAMTDLEVLLPDLRVMDTVWDLTDALSRRNGAEVLAQLRLAVRSGQHPIALTGLLASNLRQVLVAHRVLDGGGGTREIASALGQSNPWFAQRLAQSARAFSDEALTRALRELLRADLTMKSGGPPEASLELTLVGLLNAPARS